MSSPGDTHPPSEASLRHAQRKSQARVQLAGVLLLIVAAYAAFSTFALSPVCRARWPEMVGILFGSAVAILLLFGSAWARQGWARIVLVVAIVLVIAVFGMYLLMMMTNPEDANGPGAQRLSLGLTLLLGAAAWLSFSKRIRYLTTAVGSGGRA